MNPVRINKWLNQKTQYEIMMGITHGYEKDPKDLLHHWKFKTPTTNSS